MASFMLGAMASGFAQGASAGLGKFLEAEEKERLQKALLDAQEAMQIRAENRKLETAKTLRETEGTPENQAMTLNKFKIGAAEREQGLIDMRREGSIKRADGGFDVLGGDGMVRSTDAEGNLIGSARDARAYEGMSAQDIKKQDLDIQGKELQIQATKAQIAHAAAAATDRAEAKADKVALKQEYELLGSYLSSKATNPSGDYSKQIAASVSKIAALGGNPQVMIDLMLGKETSQTVAVKTGDAKMGEPETTTTNVVKGPRHGGVLPTAEPKPADGANLKGIIATAKSRGYSDAEVRDTLKKNGYSEAQIKAAGL